MPSSVLGVERAWCRRPGYTPLLLAVVGPRGGLGEPPKSFRKKLSISIPTLALLSLLIVFTDGWQQYYPACGFYSPSCREVGFSETEIGCSRANGGSVRMEPTDMSGGME